ncbi:MAG TPA: UbiA-like polyprenyltransferase [Pirellulaceae bacterium]|jgi:4-hydroxybenzoate polyprenyltransferase
MLRTIRHLLELIRFSHTLFALPFALLAAVMAWRLQFIEGKKALETPAIDDEQFHQLLGTMVKDLGRFLDWPVIGKWQGFAIRWQEIVGILLCMVTARSFAMAFNRLADRRIDAGNPRTAGRHLPAGILSVAQVTTFVILCAAGFIASTLLFLPNRLPLYLSVPVLAFLAGYSFTKRFTALAHFWLGTALALSPVTAWIAIRGEQVIAHPSDLLPALVLGAAVLTWVAGFDIIYACQDYDIDVAAGHHSIPARLGIKNSLRLAAFCHLLTIVALACLPLAYPLFGTLYWIAIAAVAILLLYEHALVRPDDLSRVNAAFFNVNAIISLGLFAAGTLDLLIHRVGY